MMNHREIFDRVKTHLLTQNAKSMSDGRCAYRGDGGRTCALGCLIPDEKYSRKFEGLSPTAYVNADALADSARRPFADQTLTKVLQEETGASSGEDVTWLRRLQYIHDQTPVQEWETALLVFEEKYVQS